MSNSYLFLLCFLLILAAAIAFFPLPEIALAESNCPYESYSPSCNNSNLFDGYWWREEGWVPGMITQRTHFVPAPPFIYGYAAYYAPGVMKATAQYMGYSLEDYLGGVAMMSCGDIGQIVWLLDFDRPYGDWIGPFLVVDCAEFDDHYPITVFRGEAVEIDYRTADQLGMIERNEWRRPFYVMKSRYRPEIEIGTRAIYYRQWFLETVKFYSPRRSEIPARYIFRQPGEWRIRGRWITYLDFQTNPLYVEGWIREVINN